MQLLSSKLISELNQYNQIFVGYSGGLDSTVLLHALLATNILAPKLVAIHINHKLSPNAFTWEKHCKQFCKEHNVLLIIKRIKIKMVQGNLENRARDARFLIFKTFIKTNTILVLAHHKNDQLETIFLHLLRGTGVDGLVGMSIKRKFHQGELLRPLLKYTRKDLENYASFMRLKWIEDESNNCINFSRNYLRHTIFPLLLDRWPFLLKNIERLSLNFEEAKINLKDLAYIDYPQLKNKLRRVSLLEIRSLSIIRQKNIITTWLKQNKIPLPTQNVLNRIMYELVLSKTASSRKVSWKNLQVICYQDYLYLNIFLQNKINLNSIIWNNFPQIINIGDKHGYIIAENADSGIKIEFNQLTSNNIEIKFRSGGETIYLKKQTKRLKQLFNEWKIPPWQRTTIPLVYIGEQLACIVGYAISDSFYEEITGNNVWRILHVTDKENAKLYSPIAAN